MKSQFGRGYATCLIQFINHAPRLAQDERLYAEMAAKPDVPLRTDGSPMFQPEDAAEIWANGAADHLVDLLHPRGITRDDWAKAQYIRDRAWRIGRTYYPGDNGTPDECRALLDEARKLLGHCGVSTWQGAFRWDAAHGLKPSEGYSATCKEPIQRAVWKSA